MMFVRLQREISSSVMRNKCANSVNGKIMIVKSHCHAADMYTYTVRKPL